MMKFVKRLLILSQIVLLVCLAPLNALGEIQGMGQALDVYFDTDEDIRMSVGFEIEELQPYGEETVGMLGGILRHLTMDVLLSGEDMVLAMCVDGQPAFSMVEQKKDGRYEMRTDILPNRVLTSSSGTLETLFPETEEKPFGFSVQGFITESEQNYQALAEAIKPYAEEKKSNYTIDDIGYAGWVRLAKLNAEQCTQLMPQIMAVLGCGMDEAVMVELANMTCPGGLTVALYRTEEGGEDIAVYIKGTVTLGENDKRTLAYNWAFTRSETQQKDSFKLELTRQKGATNKRTLEFFRNIKNEDGQLSYTCKLDMDSRQGKTVKTFQQKDSLKGTAGESLSGTITITDKLTEDGKTRTIITEYKPELALKDGEGCKVLTGSVDMTVTQSKKQMTALRVVLGENPAALTMAGVVEESRAEVEPEVIFIIGGGSLAQNQGSLSQYTVGAPPLGMTQYPVPETVVTVDLDGISPEEMAQLEDEMFQYSAGYLLRLLPFITEEDTGLLQDNMTDEDYESFFNGAQHID